MHNDNSRKFRQARINANETQVPFQTSSEDEYIKQGDTVLKKFPYVQSVGPISAMRDKSRAATLNENAPLYERYALFDAATYALADAEDWLVRRLKNANKTEVDLEALVHATISFVMGKYRTATCCWCGNRVGIEEIHFGISDAHGLCDDCYKD